MTYTVTLSHEALSDGSKVHSVVVREQFGSITPAIVIPVISFQDAMDLAEKLVDALNAHTNERAEWR